MSLDRNVFYFAKIACVIDDYVQYKQMISLF